MKKLVSVLICVLMLSCEKNDIRRTEIPITDSTKSVDIISRETKVNSSFVGEPKVSDQTFIRILHESNDKTFKMYDSLLITNNDRYLKWTKGNVEKMQIDSSLSIELERTDLGKEDNKSSIKVMLYTKINGQKSDSIVFYKFQYDLDFPEEQRFETLLNLKSDLIIWHLNTFTNHSEFAIGIHDWSKYKINQNTGKITVISKKMRYDYP